MKKTIICLLTLLMIPAIACVHAPEIRPLVPDAGQTKTTPLIASKAIEDKVRFLNGILKQDGISEEDKKIARQLLNTYTELKKLSTASAAHDSGVLQDLFYVLATVDEKYFSGIQKKDQDFSKPMALFSIKRHDILDAYLSGDYNEVVSLCKELKHFFGPDAITPGIGILYAVSLANTQMTDEAIAVGEETARQFETGPDLVYLRIKIAESYLQQMNKEKATAVYEKLADTLDEQQIAVKTLSNKIAELERQAEAQPITDVNRPEGTAPASENHPQDVTETLQKEENQISTEATGEEVKSVDEVLEEVEKLLEKNMFSEARDLLISYSGKDLSPREAEVLRQALGKVEFAEENYLEEKLSRISIKKDTEQARRLMEEDRYEEAISKLEPPESDQEANREVQELKQFAVEKLIDRERNKAAKLFLTAKETQDPVKKEKYLMDVHSILNSLIINYPSSPLNEKLKSNIKIVEEELAKLRNGAATNH
ncbi:exported hypothetical protein [uncultured Desulfobacterium sp.]|uniref:Tetratricopeptide repeat protein n=1 Tax=uncultured Desulfobacterium sp. TaxID=201089 RepID=A0A445N304_9BACT|nr:exported hypothetical protein [uncultured Desulfobacterium sp.]